MTIQEIKAKAQEKFGKTCEKVVNFFENPTVQTITIAVASSVVTGIVVHLFDSLSNSRNVYTMDTIGMLCDCAQNKGNRGYVYIDSNGNPTDSLLVDCVDETRAAATDYLVGTACAAISLSSKEGVTTSLTNKGSYVEVRLS